MNYHTNRKFALLRMIDRRKTQIILNKSCTTTCKCIFNKLPANTPCPNSCSTSSAVGFSGCRRSPLILSRHDV